MTILDVNSLDTVYAVDSDGHRQYTSTFQVRSDTVEESPITIAGDARLPKWRQKYIWPFPSDVGSTTDEWSFVRSWSIVRSEDHRGYWTATYNYTSRPIDEDNDWRGDPLSKPEQYAGSFFMAEIQTGLDALGSSIINSAEESLEVTIDNPRDTLIITANTATTNMGLRSSLINKTNNAVYYGYAAKVLRLTAWDVTRRFYPDPNNPNILKVYWENRLEFLIDEAVKHAIDYPDIGNRILRDVTKSDPAERYGYVYSTDTGDRVGGLFLDGFGKELPLPTIPGDDPTPTILSVDVYEQGDFTQLPLSGTFPADITG